MKQQDEIKDLIKMAHRHLGGKVGMGNYMLQINPSNQSICLQHYGQVLLYMRIISENEQIDVNTNIVLNSANGYQLVETLYAQAVKETKAINTIFTTYGIDVKVHYSKTKGVFIK